MNELEDFLETATGLVDATSAIAVSAWHERLAQDVKDDGSILTQADSDIERLWREMIGRRHPGHGILGEEFGHEIGRSAFTWVLDPIDGTRQFAAGLLNFASLVALCRDGIPVIGIIDLPLLGYRYIGLEGRQSLFAGRPVFTSGCRTIRNAVVSLANPKSFIGDAAKTLDKLASVGRLRVFDGGSPAYGALARGQIDICLNGPDLDSFDICALAPVVNGAGGMITDWSGVPVTMASRGAILASASVDLHAQALAVIGQS
jgi:inositol-phosphate phosphatase/L-galactose 1-phosphate phosphatase/histidinol-phosphatase